MRTIMFHRFVDPQGNTTGQGSLTARSLRQYIDSVGQDRFVKQSELESMNESSQLPVGKVLLTFDDGLLSQFETAKPVMDEFGIKAIWFVYTKTFEENFDANEILNYFADRHFQSFEDFYSAFEMQVTESICKWQCEAFRSFATEMLSRFPFYSPADLKFRFLRNFILSHAEFSHLVEALLQEFGLEPNYLAQRIWMTPDQIKILAAQGHMIGLHSHTHPYSLSALDQAAQLEELSTNSNLLQSISGTRPISVAYPLGSYNADTLSAARKLQVKFGFKSNAEKASHEEIANGTYLELPREDSAFIPSAY